MYKILRCEDHIDDKDADHKEGIHDNDKEEIFMQNLIDFVGFRDGADSVIHFEALSMA